MNLRLFFGKGEKVVKALVFSNPLNLAKKNVIHRGYFKLFHTTIFRFKNVNKNVYLLFIRPWGSLAPSTTPFENIAVHEGQTSDESHTDPCRPTLTPMLPPTLLHPSPMPPPPICLSSLSHPCPICPIPLSPLSHLSVISLGFSLSSLVHNYTALVRQTHSFHQRDQEWIFLGRGLTERPLCRAQTMSKH